MHTFDCSLFACIRRVRSMSQLQYTVAVNYGTGHTTQSSTVYPLFIHLQYNTTHSRQNLVLNWLMLHLNNKSDLLILKVKSLHQILYIQARGLRSDSCSSLIELADLFILLFLFHSVFFQSFFSFASAYFEYSVCKRLWNKRVAHLQNSSFQYEGI